MKHSWFFLLLIVGAQGYAQTIRIADNNANRPAGANIYATIQAAVDAAVSGDIVYVQPSPASYGDVTINKRLSLIGIGFNSGKDLSYTSTLGTITLTNRSDNTSNASGTSIRGIAFPYLFMGTQTGVFTYTLENIELSNCSFYMIWHPNGYMSVQGLSISDSDFSYLNFSFGGLDDLLVYRNLINGGIAFNVSVFPNPCSCGGGAPTSTLNNAMIANNIFAPGANNNFISVTKNGVVITNNVFFAGTNISGSRFITGSMTEVVVSNNIFYGTTPGSSGSPFEANTFSHNLSFGTSNDVLPPPGSGVGNTGANNIVADPLFVNAPYNTAYAATMNFNLQPSSPAKNAGSDGTDIGITGGPYPVTAGNFALMPSAAPVIMSFNPAAIVPQNFPVKANVKGKSY